MTSYAEKLKNPRWQKKRLLVFQRDDFTCQCCGSTEDTLHVHHTHYEPGREPWEYPVDDDWPHALETVCAACHEWKGELRKAARWLVGYARMLECEQEYKNLKRAAGIR